MMEVLNDVREDAMQQGIQQGKQEGEITAFVKFYKSGMIKANEAANMLNISIDEFLRLAK